MTRSVLTTLFLLSLLTCEAQMYQLTQSNQTRYYRMGNSNFAASLHVIEAGIVDGDSVFVFEPQLISATPPDADGCYTFDASWLGSGMRISPQGNTHIISGTGEEVLLLTQAEEGEMWVAWTAGDGSMHLEATATSIAEETVMGETDMVLSIALEMVYDEGAPGTSVFDQTVVKIGANYGLVETPLWAAFPWHTDAMAISYAGDARIEGIEGESGWQDFNWMEVMDFELGDEIHIDQGSNLGFGEGSWTKSAITFLSREDYADSTVYEVERVWWSFNDQVAPDEDPISDEGTSIEAMVIYPDPLFDTRPYAPVFFEDGMMAGFSLMGMDGDLPFKTHGIDNTIAPYMDSSDSEGCYFPLMHSECATFSAVSYPGLGGPYYDCDFESGPGGQWRKLVYYKKDNVEWGSPLSTTDERFEKRISLLTYPNPSNGSFRIALDAYEYPAEIKVYDLRGRMLYRQILNSQEGEIQIPFISPQLLMLQVNSFAGNLYNGRVLLVE